MRIFWDLFENGTIAKQYYVRRCNERTSCTKDLWYAEFNKIIFLQIGLKYMDNLKRWAVRKKNSSERTLVLETERDDTRVIGVFHNPN